MGSLLVKGRVVCLKICLPGGLDSIAVPMKGLPAIFIEPHVEHPLFLLLMSRLFSRSSWSGSLLSR